MRRCCSCRASRGLLERLARPRGRHIVVAASSLPEQAVQAAVQQPIEAEPLLLGEPDQVVSATGHGRGDLGRRKSTPAGGAFARRGLDQGRPLLLRKAFL